ncbi:type I restriction enzyme, S subunit [Parageobacillus thermantarcticus]|uniref:Type I restriction enzyme, S subunit n=1 Tax=Parageobacillus thermantarcticus TaxID=186116 RepID=A0A1I0T605_9BACL|nr:MULTISPECIES: restriction endonuclease subunit S [Bacillaceae]SFA47179.1 type I restriction enzyme, S subunit [Parageobacillus thermantarcticus]
MSNWIKVKLGDIVELKRESYQPKPDEVLPYIGLEHIGQGTLRLISVGKSNEVTSTKSYFSKGDILFGKLRPYFRKVVRPKFNGVCSTDILVLTSKNPRKFNQTFLFYLMASQEMIDLATASSSGTKMPRADWKVLQNLEISIPEDVNEQERIGKILETIDDKIDINIRMNKTLEEMAMTLYKHWFVDFGPFQDGEFVESELGVIPNNWKIGQVKDLAKVLSGKRPKVKDIGEYPIFGGGGPMGVTNEYLYNEPIFITGRVGTIGKVFRVSKPCWPSDNSLVLIPLKAYYYSFLYAVLKNIDFSLITGGSTQPLITQTSLKSIKVIIPPEETIEQYNKQVLTYYSLIDKNDNINKQLSEIRDYLLPRLLSGEIDVSKAEKQVEEVL